METFEANLTDLQPSQLYLSDEKLAEVERSLAAGEVLDPVPVIHLDGREVLTDGHTRAFAAFRRGDRTIPAIRETDELDWDAYRVCVGWCLEAGIASVADLEGRIVPGGRFEELWIRRCRRMHRQLRSSGDEGGYR